MLTLLLLFVVLHHSSDQTLLPYVFLFNLLEVSCTWFLTLTVVSCEWSRYWLAGHTCPGSFLHSGHYLHSLDLFSEGPKVINVCFKGQIHIMWFRLLFFLPDEPSFLSIGVHSPLLYIINITITDDTYSPSQRLSLQSIITHLEGKE